MKTRTVYIACIMILSAALAFVLAVLHTGTTPETPPKTAPSTPALEPTVATESVPATQAPVPTEPTVPEPTADGALEAALEQLLSGVDDEWAVYVEPLSGESITVVSANIQPDAPLISASIIKMFIMAAVYDQVNQGLLDADSVYPDVYAMITSSSNEAANRLVHLLGGGDETAGMEAVNAYAAAIGCRETALNRLMLVENGLQNYVSCRDCALLLRQIYNGQCVSPEYSAVMLQILLEQTSTDFLPAGVPDGVPIAHKTGNLLGLCHGDVGIVMAESNPYIVCIICNNPTDMGAAMARIPEISATVYRYMVQPS